MQVYNTVQHPLLRLLLKVPQWQARLSYSRLPCFARLIMVMGSISSVCCQKQLCALFAPIGMNAVMTALMVYACHPEKVLLSRLQWHACASRNCNAQFLQLMPRC